MFGEDSVQSVGLGLEKGKKKQMRLGFFGSSRAPAVSRGPPNEYFLWDVAQSPGRRAHRRP